MALKTASQGSFITWTDWAGYEGFLDLLRERRIRVTYFRGTLELMSPSPLHERLKKILSALLECLLEEEGLDFQGGGSTTFKRRAKELGLEPDECYWIRHLADILKPTGEDEEAVAPDLALEVEVSRSALKRLDMYALLGVSEVWRWVRGRKPGLRIHVLVQPGHYDQSVTSPTFPGLDVVELERWVQAGLSQGQSHAVRGYRAWLRSRRT